MTVVLNGDMCRLVVWGPDRQIEVAVPAQVPVADLLPALLHHMGDGLADAGLAHGGWVLQRVDGTALDEDDAVESLGLRDGEPVYLRPRSDQIPPVDFDDLIDGVADGTSRRPGRWRPEMIRWAALGMAAVALLLGLAVLAMPGPLLPRELAAAGVALGCLAGGYAVARVDGDGEFGLVLSMGAVGYAGLAGLIGPDVTGGAAGVVIAGPQVLLGSVAVLVFAVLGAVAIGRGGPLSAAVAVCALLASLGGGLVAFGLLAKTESAAVVAVASTVMVVVVPSIAFRLAGMRLEPLPTAPEHLQEDIDPVAPEPLLARTFAADRYMTALHAGAAAAGAVAMVLLGPAPGWAGPTLAALIALVRLLSIRPMNSGWHRLAVAAPAVVGLAIVALSAAASAAPLPRLALAIGALPLAVTYLFALALTLPGRRIMPYWGRIGDVVQLLATLAVLPVLLAQLGVYGAVRALGG